MEFDINVVNGELVESEQVRAVMARAHELDLSIKRQKIELDSIKDALKATMEAHGIKSLDTDEWHADYIAETTRKTVDTEALKEQGMFEMFSKTSVVKPSMRLTFKND